MANSEQFEEIVGELIDIVHELTREMEKFLVQVERATGPLHSEARLSILASELSELRRRFTLVTA